MVRRAAATAVLLLGTLAGCSLEGPVKADPGERPAPFPDITDRSSTSSIPANAIREVAELDREPAAKRQTRRALNRLFRAGTGAFSVTYSIPAFGMAQDSGNYDLLEESWEVRRDLNSNGEEVHLDVRAAEERVWMYVRDVTNDVEWPCWLQLEGRFAEQIGLGRRAPHPAPIVAASWVQGREMRGNDVVGTVDLVTAAALLSGNLATRIALPPRTREKVVADVFLTDDGAMSGFDVRVADLFTGLVDAGADLPFSADDARSLTGSVNVRFGLLGDRVDIAPPPEDQVAIPGPRDDVEDAMASCAGVGHGRA